jgi:hypothetical protein
MMTVSQAQAVNTVLDFMLQRGRPGTGPPTGREASEAARVLAGHARRALQAGIGPQDIPGEIPARHFWTEGALAFCAANNAGRLTANHLWAREIMDCPDPPHEHGHCLDGNCPNAVFRCRWHNTPAHAKDRGVCTRTVAAATICVDVLQLLGVPVPLSATSGRTADV